MSKLAEHSSLKVAALGGFSKARTADRRLPYAIRALPAFRVLLRYRSLRSPVQTFDPINRCAICGQPILLQDSKVVEDGKPTHEDCFLAKVKIRNIGRAKPTRSVRCPYCVFGDGFRQMLSRADGRYECQKCGHLVMTDDPDFKCSCKRCQEI
jgi:DNA-directed RNA polymerase subunit RPC12/RpoP